MYMRQKKQVNPAYMKCVEVYQNWFENKYPYPMTFNGRAGKSLNEILDKLSKSYKIAKGDFPTVDELVLSFKLVLDKNEMWGFWKDKCFHVWSINDKLIEILEEIKKHNATTKEQRTISAYESIKDL